MRRRVLRVLQWRRCGAIDEDLDEYLIELDAGPREGGGNCGNPHAEKGGKAQHRSLYPSYRRVGQMPLARGFCGRIEGWAAAVHAKAGR